MAPMPYTHAPLLDLGLRRVGGCGFSLSARKCLINIVCDEKIVAPYFHIVVAKRMIHLGVWTSPWAERVSLCEHVQAAARHQRFPCLDPGDPQLLLTGNNVIPQL